MTEAEKNRDRLYSFVIMIIFFATVVCDIVPYSYVHPCLKEVFTYDFATVVPIGLAMWAFTTSLFVLFFTKKDECYMGISYSELYKSGFDETNNLIQKWTIIAILIMVLSVFFHFPITLFFCVLFQLFIMIYALYKMKKLLGHTEAAELILKNLNQYLKNVIGQIQEDAALSSDTRVSGNEEVLILKVIRRADLMVAANQEVLIKILMDSDLKQLHEGRAVAVGRLLAESILAVDVPKTIKFNLLQQFFLMDECSVDMRKGILFALIEQMNYDILRFVGELIEQVDSTITSQLAAWYAAVYVIVTKLQGKEEKAIFLLNVKRDFQTYKRHFPDTDWKKLVKQEWLAVCKLLNFDPMKDIKDIFKIINER